MLATRLTPALRSTLPAPGAWRAWPSARDRAAWDAVLTPARREWILAKAEAAIANGWPALPASLYLDCARTGNRVRGEAVIFARRQHMAFVTLAFAATREPRWLDAALDALWALAEESTWCLPAHSGHHPTSKHMGLPRHATPVVDLFAAETGAVIADALDLLREDLDALDAPVVPRLIHELQVRIVDPVTTIADWGWLDGHNNWTPWIVANAGRVVLAHARDRAGLEQVVERFLGAGDRFLANYGPDGGCDEGIRYWGVAFGTLFLFLEHLHHASGGRIALFDHPQFAALGAFPVNAHLGGRWFLPFADNIGTGGVRRALGWRVGERLGLPGLQDIAWLESRGFDAAAPAEPLLPGGNGSSLQDLLWQLFWLPENPPRPAAPPPAERTWLPNLQVLVARSPGLVLAVKGGHNGENHNHNDVGCVHVLKGGLPVVIDPGVEAYSMRTFSAERYQIWCIRGSGHNAPVVNGHEQQTGKQHAAREVSAGCVDGIERFSADLAGCYAPAAGLRRAVRTVRFDRAAQRITVDDVVEGDGALDVVTTWYACEDPRGGRFTLTFPGATVDIAEFPLEDALLRRSWRCERLWRVTATVRGTGRVAASLQIS
jgi:hypothetical protein